MSGLAFVGHLIVKRGGMTYIGNAFGLNRSITGGEKSVYRARVDYLKTLPVRTGAVVMLGDSLTERAEWSELFPGSNILNRGVGGDTVPGANSRIDDYLGDKPQKLFIMFGANDLMRHAPVEAILADYRRLLKHVRDSSPATAIFVQAVLPCAQIPAIATDSLNKGLARLATETGTTFIDTSSPFRTTDGKPDPRLFLQDGIHLTADGYWTWRKVIAPAIRRR